MLSVLREACENKSRAARALRPRPPRRWRRRCARRAGGRDPPRPRRRRDRRLRHQRLRDQRLRSAPDGDDSRPDRKRRARTSATPQRQRRRAAAADRRRRAWLGVVGSDHVSPAMPESNGAVANAKNIMVGRADSVERCQSHRRHMFPNTSC